MIDTILLIMGMTYLIIILRDYRYDTFLKSPDTVTEAKIYFDNYQLIAKGVKFLANHYKINLVLRYNSEDMDLEKGDSVIRGVMKNIVYHDKALDMTQGVMQYLDKTIPTEEIADRGSATLK